MTVQEFVTTFRPFRNQEELTDRLLTTSRLQPFRAGTQLYWEGDSCAGIAFLLAGGIRVYTGGEAGREITLYEIEPGETCILNSFCILGGRNYPANAVTSSDGQMLLVPAEEFRGLMERFEAMREFVFSLLSQRLTEILGLVQEVAFARMDERVFNYLLEKSAAGILAATHQRIANDLGTSREVVSRVLKEFERQGRVSLGRNAITLHAAT